MQSRFQEYKYQNQNKTFLYTGSSKQGDKVGFGVAAAHMAAHLDYGKPLLDKLSIVTTETTATLAAVKICILRKCNNLVMCLDSKPVLQALRNVYNQTHHIIALTYKEIPADQNISFL